MIGTPACDFHNHTTDYLVWSCWLLPPLMCWEVHKCMWTCVVFWCSWWVFTEDCTAAGTKQRETRGDKIASERLFLVVMQVQDKMTIWNQRSWKQSFVDELGSTSRLCLSQDATIIMKTLNIHRLNFRPSILFLLLIANYSIRAAVILTLPWTNGSSFAPTWSQLTLVSNPSDNRAGG